MRASKEWCLKKEVSSVRSRIILDFYVYTPPVFIRMWDESYRRRLGSLPLLSCDVFRALITSLKLVLNWANVCLPEHTSDTSTTYDSFLNWTFSSPNMVRTDQTLLHSQLACNEMQASARTCGRRAADNIRSRRAAPICFARAATNIIFVATKVCLSRQKQFLRQILLSWLTCVCRDKTRLLSRQKYDCRDKTFASTNTSN